MGLQSPMASMLSERLGPVQSIFIIHIGGAIAAFVPLVLVGSNSFSNWRSVPWFAWGAGVLGLVVIGAVSFTIPRIGAAPTTMLIVAGQLVIGALIDNFGWLGVDKRPLQANQLLGFLALFLGLWLILRPK